MQELTGDEWAFTVCSAAIALGIGLPFWILPLRIRTAGRRWSLLFLALILPAVAIAPTLTVLNLWADPVQVIGHPDYIFLFLVGAGAWIAIATRAMPLIGISIRDDVIERGNPAALCSAWGWTVGIGLVYAMANVGGGPTIWTTIVPAAAGTLAFVALWFLTEIVSGGLAELVTVERDTAAGIRTLGASLGIALILGRAVGGNWVDWQKTWTDFAAFAWPAIPLAIAVGLLHRINRPTMDHPRPDPAGAGVIPALLFCLAGFALFAFTPNALHPSKW
jgi:uncharacterized membrane protein YjfL (UPF0719 family)